MAVLELRVENSGIFLFLKIIRYLLTSSSSSSCPFYDSFRNAF